MRITENTRKTYNGVKADVVDLGPPTNQLLIAWRSYNGKEENKEKENNQKEKC